MIYNKKNNYDLGHRSFILVILFSCLVIGIGWIIGIGFFVPVFLVLLGASILIIVFFKPSSPIIFGYALITPVWSYMLPYIGRPEKIIAVLCVLGLIIHFTRRKQISLTNVSPLVLIGSVVVIGSYLISWATHSWVVGASEYFLSLLMRITFLFLPLFLISTKKDMSIALGSFIACSFIPAIYTLIANISFGWGFVRMLSYLDMSGFNQGAWGWSILYSANQGSAAAILLLGLYPFASKKWHKVLIVVLCLFLFTMAFASQFRREMLISPIIIFLYLICDKKLGLRNPAFVMLIFTIVIFALLFFPTEVFQMRLTETTKIFLGTETRMVSGRAGIEALLKNPIFGYGPNSYRTTIGRILSNHTSKFETSPYNVFIWVAVEAGIFGLGGLVLLLIGVYLYRNKLQNNLPPTLIWVFRCAPALILLFFLWFSFGNNWDLSQPWFLMGVILAAGNLVE